MWETRLRVFQETADGALPVRDEAVPEGLRSDLDPRDVTQPDEVAVLAPREDEPSEVLRGLVAPPDAHAETVPKLGPRRP